MTRLGLEHNTALIATAIACAVFMWLGRRLRDRPAAIGVGRALAIVLLAAQLADPFISAHYGRLDLQNGLPLELCDASGLAVMFALWTRRQAAFELAYFWGLSGGLMALLMPDMPSGIPMLELSRFFFMHAGILAGIFYLGPGLGMRPRPHSEWKVFGWTLLYAAAIGAINQMLGANYMYLCRTPPDTPLDWFGPWPWFLFGAAAMTIAMYLALALPYRFSRNRLS